ncbi:hypothetical protein V5799_018741 [Amblyomma americanum]|uniref:Peptidase A1 domain-containing protein n=1 Tax=Amblyomma americanum TaxID=6943 RepID=A0AAQ4EZ85_AMBAM
MHTCTILLKVGTPRQEFNVSLDTSLSTWLPSSSCSETGLCSGRKKLNKSNSTSISRELQVEELKFRRGTVTGRLSRDVHELAGVGIGQCYFIDAESLHGVQSNQDVHFDGVLGLVMRPFPLLKDLYNARIIANP